MFSKNMSKHSKMIAVLIVICLFIFIVSGQLVGSHSDSRKEFFQDMKSGVVLVLTAEMEGIHSGSGYFVDDNLIVTNYHVIAGGMQMKINTETNMKTYEVEVVAGDPLLDIAILRLKNWKDFYHDNPNFHIFKFSNDRDIYVGESVWTIGNPNGFINTISRGIVTGMNRKLEDVFPIYAPNYYIQTDANVFHGNSGGPLIDNKGNVVGMNTLILPAPCTNEETGGACGEFSFAIDASLLTKVVNDLLDQEESKWPFLGIIAEADHKTGRWSVMQLLRGSPGENILKVGDIITGIITPNTDSDGVDSNDFNLIRKEIFTIKVGETITMKIIRDGKPMQLPVVMSKYFTSSQLVYMNSAKNWDRDSNLTWKP